MPTPEDTPAAAMITSENAPLFVSLELSRSTWLLTALSASQAVSASFSSLDS